MLLFHFDYVYEDSTEPENKDHQPFFNTVNGHGDDTRLLNARMAWNIPGGGYEMALWGKNLMGNDCVSQPGCLTGTDIGTYHVGIVDPLTYGVDFRVIF